MTFNFIFVFAFCCYLRCSSAFLPSSIQTYSAANENGGIRVGITFNETVPLSYTIIVDCTEDITESATMGEIACVSSTNDVSSASCDSRNYTQISFCCDNCTATTETVSHFAEGPATAGENYTCLIIVNINKQTDCFIDTDIITATTGVPSLPVLDCSSSREEFTADSEYDGSSMNELEYTFVVSPEGKVYRDNNTDGTLIIADLNLSVGKYTVTAYSENEYGASENATCEFDVPEETTNVPTATRTTTSPSPSPSTTEDDGDDAGSNIGPIVGGVVGGVAVVIVAVVVVTAVAIVMVKKSQSGMMKIHSAAQ